MKRFGKSFESYLAFINTCERGMKSLYVHPDYVVMSHEYYEALITGKPKIFIDEESRSGEAQK